LLARFEVVPLFSYLKFIDTGSFARFRAEAKTSNPAGRCPCPNIYVTAIITARNNLGTAPAISTVTILQVVG
jgi:hypothetical protein